MTPLEVSDYKMIATQILRGIKLFCEENHVTYYLAYGTLLGAIRHKGFIPWDDDIDICMPREDYEFFLSHFQSDSKLVLSCNHSKGYYLPYAKVVDTRTIVKETIAKTMPNCGVFVDVFPLDGLTNSPITAKYIHKKMDHLMRLNQIINLVLPCTNSVKHICKKIVILIVPVKDYAKKIDRYAKKYSFRTSKLVGVAFGYGHYKDTMPQSVFSSASAVTFEGDEYPAPLQYDAYLRAIYGDYMQLPPIEQQVTHHSYRAFIKDGYRLADFQ